MHGCEQAYQSVKPRVLHIFDEIIGECVNSRTLGGNESEDDRWRVYLTGHSMGGALATLCAYELAVSHCLVSKHTVGGLLWDQHAVTCNLAIWQINK